MKTKVKCLECGRELGTITSQHLKNCCGLTIKQYKDKYPNAETVSEKVKEVRRNNCKKINAQMKTVTCIKCKINTTEVPVAMHWDWTCDECLKPETYPGKIYLPDKDLVICQICWQGMEQISYKHTHYIHGISLQEYRKKFPKAWVTNKRIRELRRKRGISGDNPARRKDVRKKMSRIQRFTAEQWTERYPWIFPEIEKIRDGVSGVEVKCKKCGNWFQASGIQFGERIRALSYGSDGLYLYCSDKCKGTCPLYRLQPLQYIKEVTEKPFTDTEYQVFRNEVLKRQKVQYGSNFCEMCEETKNLHIHHEKPQKTHPIMSLDPDNGIVLCEHCHLNKAHKDLCSTANLSKLICNPAKK